MSFWYCDVSFFLVLSFQRIDLLVGLKGTRALLFVVFIGDLTA